VGDEARGVGIVGGETALMGFDLEGFDDLLEGALALALALAFAWPVRPVSKVFFLDMAVCWV
jgi:hypothetical protein